MNLGGDTNLRPWQGVYTMSSYSYLSQDAFCSAKDYPSLFMLDSFIAWPLKITYLCIGL